MRFTAYRQPSDWGEREPYCTAKGAAGRERERQSVSLRSVVPGYFILHVRVMLAAGQRKGKNRVQTNKEEGAVRLGTKSQQK